MGYEKASEQPTQISHLFMLRMRLEDLGDGHTDWRGKVQHINSGEVRYFREWTVLETFIEGLLHNGNLSEAPSIKTDNKSIPPREI